MSEARSKRKLAAILSADVVGYSRLMANDEAATVETLTQYRSAVGNIVERHQGRIVNAPGDNILAEFASAVEAVRAAVEIQRSIQEKNADLSEERRMRFRVGVNLGDIIEQADGTIYGDGVNIAARLEALAEEGGICISSTIHDAVEGKLDFGFEFLGERPVKNIEKPVRVYRVHGEPGEKPKKPTVRKNNKIPLVVASSVVAVAIAAVTIWQTGRGPEMEEIETTISDDPALLLPTGPRIAVLPFENMSGDPEQEYFSDGITEDIITRLTHFPRFLVIARNSTNQYKGQPVDVRRLGTELGAQYVVEGSVRKVGKAVRVTAQLIDAKDGTHIWAGNYDRDLTTADLFEIQDQITEQVAGTIAGARGIITTTQMEAIESKPTESLDAYECVLRSIKYYEAVGARQHKDARACLERAVKLDPNYADAWGLLAITYVDESRFGFNQREGSLDRALKAAQTSVRLDSKGEFGQHALAMAHFHRNELDQFHVASARAIENNPNHSYTLAEMADKLFWSGQTERGYALMRKAAALNPNHPGWYNIVPSAYHYLKNDYDNALNYALEIQMPEFFWNQAHLAANYAQLGRSEEAQASRKKLLELYPSFEKDCRGLFRAFNVPDRMVDPYVDGFRKAGLNIPEKPS